MNKFILRPLFIIFILFFSKALDAEEFDSAKSKIIFDQMFGEKYKNVKKTSTKKDDDAYALELIQNAEILKTKPGLQIYVKLMAAKLIENSPKNKKKSRDLFIEVLPKLPVSLNLETLQVIVSLQKKILKNTNRKKKDDYNTEVEIYVNYLQLVSKEYIGSDNYVEAVKNLKEAQRIIRLIDKDAAKMIALKIKMIQKKLLRFKKIKNFLIQLKTKKTDPKINKEVAEYYLYEQNSFVKAWPYLSRTTDETLSSFFKLIKLCFDDQKLRTGSGLSLSAIALIDEHPIYLLKMLSENDVDDPGNIIDATLKKLKAGEKIKSNSVKLIIQNTIKKHGKLAEISHSDYLKLADLFKQLYASYVSKFKITKDKAELFASSNQFILNQFIALEKAKLKMTKNKIVDEISKLKLDLEIGKCLKQMNELKIENMTVEIATPFVFNNSFDIDGQIEVSGGAFYSFDASSWGRFKKDWRVLDSKGKDVTLPKSLKESKLPIDSISGNKTLIISKKLKWKNNLEVSFDVKKYTGLKGSIYIHLPLIAIDQKNKEKEFYLLSRGWKKSCGMIQFFGTYLTIALLKNTDNSTWSSTPGAYKGKLAGMGSLGIWNDSKNKANKKGVKEKIRIRVIRANKMISFYADNNKVFEISEKNAESKNLGKAPVTILFTSGNPIIDDLYIGPPKKIKK